MSLNASDALLGPLLRRIDQLEERLKRAEAREVGDWGAWSPVLYAGGVLTTSLVAAQYWITGSLLILHYAAQIAADGAAGNRVIITQASLPYLPLQRYTAGTANVYNCYGTCYYYDASAAASAQRIVAAVVWSKYSGAEGLAFVPHKPTSDIYLGDSGTLAGGGVQTSDMISFTSIYEIDET